MSAPVILVPMVVHVSMNLTSLAAAVPLDSLELSAKQVSFETVNRTVASLPHWWITKKAHFFSTQPNIILLFFRDLPALILYTAECPAQFPELISPRISYQI